MNVNLRSKRDFFSQEENYITKNGHKKCNGEQNGKTYILDRMDLSTWLIIILISLLANFLLTSHMHVKKCHDVDLTLFPSDELCRRGRWSYTFFSRLNIINELLPLFTMIWHQVMVWTESRKLLFHIWVDQSSYKVCRLVRFSYVLLVKIITSILCDDLEIFDLENENSNNLPSGHDNDPTKCVLFGV